MYQQFRETARVLRAISVSGGGPTFPPTSVTCVAKDRGWEEHFQGHGARGRTIYEAQQQALLECQRYHGRCVIQNCN